jgi:hypothetical protein
MSKVDKENGDKRKSVVADIQGESQLGPDLNKL